MNKITFKIIFFLSFFQFILLLLVSDGLAAPKPQDNYGAPPAPAYNAPAAETYGAPAAPEYNAPAAETYGAPAAPAYNAPAAEAYGAPQAPVVDSYGAPQAPVCRVEQSPSPIPGAECNPNAPDCVEQVENSMENIVQMAEAN